MTRQPTRRPKIALAFSGGGPLGAIYEVGALCALQESLNGIDFTQLQHYVGVSAGGFIAAGLANDITPLQLCASFIENDNEPSETFDPSRLLAPAHSEFARRAIRLPSLFVSALWHLSAGRQSFVHALERMGPALPTGLFSNEQIHVELGRLFSQERRTNDFCRIKTQLKLVAIDLNSGEVVPIGRPGWGPVPTSRAVQASFAMPGLLSPVATEGNHFIDGALKKTMHASVALDQGMGLTLCVNPLVPFDAMASATPIVMQRRLSGEHLHIPQLVAGRREPELYLANAFSSAQRRHQAAHPCHQASQLLHSRKTGLSAKLKRHGITLHHDALDDPTRQENTVDLGHIVNSAALKEKNTW